MNDTAYLCALGLLIWWAAMTVLCLRDYSEKRNETRKKGPLTEQERAELEKVRAELPRKEIQPAWWYFLHPKEGARLGVLGLSVLPFVIIFLPMIVLLRILPNPNRK